MRRVLLILLIIPVLYLIVIPVYLVSLSNGKPCGGIEINIRDSADYHFVTKRQLLNIAYGSSGRILGKPVRDVSVSEIESRLLVLRELKEVEVYIGDFFIDEEGVVVRKRNLYTPRLHIVGGNVNITQAMLNGVSILDTSIKNTILRDIYYMVNHINDDKFWSAQIDQIYVDSNDEIDIIPRVGNQVIHLGTTENIQGKLRNMEAFYDKVLPETGWNKYSYINLEYKDQIVCKKR